MNFLTLPAYRAGNPLDFSPITSAIESNRRNALASAAQEMQERQFGLQQQQFDLTKRDSDRQHTNALAREAVYREIAANPAAAGFNDPAAIAGFRLAGADGAADYVSKSRSYDLDKMRTRAQVNASNAQADATRGGEQRAKDLHPLDRQLRQKQIDAAKIGRAKDDEYLYVPDPTQPGGVRIVQPASGGAGNKKFADESAKAQVERYTKSIEAGDLAERSAVDMATLRQLADKVGDPSLSNTLARTLGPYARSLGVDITNMGQIEAFTAVVSRLAPNMRPPGSGATSDFEFKQYLGSLPQLAQTAEGRRLIMDQFEVFAQHALAKREIAARVLNGDIDRREGERLMQRLPDPLQLWKQRTGAPGAQGGQQPGALPPGYNIRRVDGPPQQGAARQPAQSSTQAQSEGRRLVDREFQTDIARLSAQQFLSKYSDPRILGVLSPEQRALVEQMGGR